MPGELRACCYVNDSCHYCGGPTIEQLELLLEVGGARSLESLR